MELNNISIKAAAVYYCYNRLDHTLKSLPKIIEYKGDLPLFIFCDGAKEGDEVAVEKVRDYVNKHTRNIKTCEVISRNTNLGLAPNVISGVNLVFDKGYEAVMVLEDDCVPKSDFFTFMTNALQFYNSNPKVMHISGFGMPLKTKIEKDSYITPYPCSWGWGTWKNKWEHCNFEDKEAYEKILSNKSLIKLFNWSGKSFSFFFRLTVKRRR